jgi:hypothetical protein
MVARTGREGIAALRGQLMVLRARYDSGAVSPAMYAVIAAIETDIAWAEHRASQRGRDA